MIDRDKVIPYGIAGLVVALVALLVAIDVVASLPGARPEPPQESPAAVKPFVIETRRDGPTTSSRRRSRGRAAGRSRFRCSSIPERARSCSRPR